MKDEKIKEKFIELRTQGLSFDKISKELHTSKQTLINWSKELAIEIANLKAIEREALQEQYLLLVEQRIKFFGEKIKIINEELNKRDLSNIPAEKLFELLLKYYGAFKEESVELSFKAMESPNLDFGVFKEWAT